MITSVCVCVSFETTTRKKPVCAAHTRTHTHTDCIFVIIKLTLLCLYLLARCLLRISFEISEYRIFFRLLLLLLLLFRGQILAIFGFDKISNGILPACIIQFFSLCFTHENMSHNKRCFVIPFIAPLSLCSFSSFFISRSLSTLWLVLILFFTVIRSTP